MDLLLKLVHLLPNATKGRLEKVHLFGDLCLTASHRTHQLAYSG
jgi:hypothetical protein